MTTNVTIAQQQHRNVLSLPISTVHREGGRQYVTAARSQPVCGMRTTGKSRMAYMTVRKCC
jgi:hypothetical protein